MLIYIYKWSAFQTKSIYLSACLYLVSVLELPFRNFSHDLFAPKSCSFVWTAHIGPLWHGLLSKYHLRTNYQHRICIACNCCTNWTIKIKILCWNFFICKGYSIVDSTLYLLCNDRDQSIWQVLLFLICTLYYYSNFDEHFLLSKFYKFILQSYFSVKRCY